MAVLNLAFLLLLPGQIATVDAPAFSKDLQKSAITATVRIENRTLQAEGSGVILGRKGAAIYILTAYHVVERGERLEVALFSSSSYPRPARTYRSVRVVARTDSMRDLALLRVVTDDALPSSLPLCPERWLPKAAGFKALTVGCAAGEAPTAQVEEVTAKRRVSREGESTAATCWEVDGKQAEGRSGGPLVDRQGRLLGVCSGTSKDKSYFCHVDEVRAFLKDNGFDWLF